MTEITMNIHMSWFHSRSALCILGGAIITHFMPGASCAYDCAFLF